MHRSILRPCIICYSVRPFCCQSSVRQQGINLKQVYRVVQVLLCSTEEVSAFQIFQQCLTVRLLLWRRVQEVTADVEWEDQEPAVQVHYHLLLVFL